MKLPTLFLPERDMGGKTEELKQKPEPKKPQHITIEELLENNMEIFYGNIKKLFDFRERAKKSSELENKAFDKIIEDTYAGKISWKLNKKDYSYTAEATIKNYAGEEMTIPFLLRTDFREIEDNMWAFMHLGDKRGPCKNTYDSRIDHFARNYFKIDPTGCNIKIC